MNRASVSRVTAAAVAAVALGIGAPVARAKPATLPPARFAIVIGNNVPEGHDAAVLRYADDDAVAMQALFSQDGIDSVLLVSPDATTRAMNPHLPAHGRPSWHDLSATVARLRGEIRAAHARGRKVDFWLFYSGHGDVDHGEGYVVLQDRRFTRAMLYRDVLAALGADRNHVIVDACRSYFLAFAKGPGGSRRRYGHSFAETPQALSIGETGFVLSTSSDRDSHEWERLGAGVFSYEVRSALRGAADANGDGVITYAELGAFLATANAAIVNPQLRPDFAVRPGGSLSEPVLTWRKRPRAITLDRPKLGHLYMETAAGERVLDANATAGETLVVVPPPGRPLFVRTADGSQEFVLGGDAPVRLSALTPHAPLVAAKGALELALRSLFDEPFGPGSVALYRRRYAAEGLAVEPVSPPAGAADVALSRSRAGPSSVRSRLRKAAMWTAIAGAGVGVAITMVAAERYLEGSGASQRRRAELNDQIGELNTVSIVPYSVAAAGAATWAAALLWPHERAVQVAATPTAGGGAEVSISGRW